MCAGTAELCVLIWRGCKEFYCWSIAALFPTARTARCFQGTNPCKDCVSGREAGSIQHSQDHIMLCASTNSGKTRS